METISTFLTKKIIQRGIIESEKQEIYKTGINLILADVINFSLILLIGFVTKSFLYACIYLIMFGTVRRFSGGFHAKTYILCRMFFVGTYLSIFLVSFLLNNWFIVSVVVDLFAIMTMYLFAPIPHRNKNLSEKEKKVNKFFALITTLFFIILSIFFTMIGLKEGMIISLTLLAITVFMYIGMLTNMKGGDDCFESD